MGKIIWITGASGFSARHLVSNLRRNEPDSRLIGLARQPAANPDFDAWHAADITDAESWKQAVSADPPDLVYHLAGAVHPAAEDLLWFTNVAATRLLIEAISTSGKPTVRLLVSSSAAVYRPTPETVDEQAHAGGANAYGRSKWGQEQIALASGREFGVEVIIARAFNLIGPGLPERLLAGRVCAQCLDSTDRCIKTGDLSAVRDFIDIRDAVEAYRLLMDQGVDGGIYNVASGEGISVRILVETLAKLAGGLEVVESREFGNRGVDRSCGNFSKLAALGWKPQYPLKHSLQDMLEAASRPS
ncbi:MAG: NAD(P)-dependent oxidoreductase [Verrucomicrobiota bacterium]